MTADKDEFFKEVTLRVCSSLDINTALGRVFEYMREYVPLNQLLLSISDVNLEALRLIATATDGSIEAPEAIFSPPKDHWQLGLELREPCIISASHQDPRIRAIARFIKQGGFSGLLLPLRVEDDRIGFLIFSANGDDRYTPDHVELLAALAKPFAIALANTLAYKSVLKCPDMLIDDNRFLSKELHSSKTGDGIIGANSGLRNVMEMVQQVTPQNTSVLLVGETGTGKEVIANSIHFASPRQTGPLIKVNCGAIPENLIDDELFGHEKGAFTGAVTEKRGRFERANGGTLFLDEIGELPLQSQVRLLRVLQSKLISRVGGEKTIPVNVRIIAATNRDLKRMISEKQFREDLWFRLNVFPITVPPLRHRKEDIPAFIRHFVAQKSKGLNIAVPPAIAPSAYERLMNYSWPGNVRELENIVERELICYRGGELRFDCPFLEEEIHETVSAEAGLHDDPFILDKAMSAHINRALEMTRGKIHGPGGAAELLGINPNTLRSRMRKLGIQCGHNGHKDSTL